MKLYTVFKITHGVWNYTLFVKLHISCVEYQSSFFCVPIGRFYTWLIFFTQPAVVMVVTNIRYAWAPIFLISSWNFSDFFFLDFLLSRRAPLLREVSVSEQPGLSWAQNTNSQQTIKRFSKNYLFQTLLRILCAHQKSFQIFRFKERGWCGWW